MSKRERFDKLLILDLDGTLICASETPLSRPEDFRAGDYLVYKRPYVEGFLKTVLTWFEVAVWTSASSPYAAEILNGLLGGSGELSFVFSGEQCTRRYDPDGSPYIEVKRLHKLKRRGFLMSKILIVDDTPKTFSLNYGNGIRVSEYKGSPDDKELLDLLMFLESLGPVENVRCVEKRGWRNRLQAAGTRRH